MFPGLLTGGQWSQEGVLEPRREIIGRRFNEHHSQGIEVRSASPQQLSAEQKINSGRIPRSHTDYWYDVRANPIQWAGGGLRCEHNLHEALATLSICWRAGPPGLEPHLNSTLTATVQYHIYGDTCRPSSDNTGPGQHGSLPINKDETAVERTEANHLYQPLERNHPIKTALAMQKVPRGRRVEGIRDDDGSVAEYVEDIYAYMTEREATLLSQTQFVIEKSAAQKSMRLELLGWMIHLHRRLALAPETLFLAVNYINRVLSFKPVARRDLRLVGATAMSIAAKYEESKRLKLRAILYGNYTVQEIVKKELSMLTDLQFELGWPGPMEFLSRVGQADEYDDGTYTTATYLLETTIMDERLVGCPSSFLAAGAYCLAQLMRSNTGWSYAHVYYSGYTYSQLHSLISRMLHRCASPRKHHKAVHDKFSSKQCRLASLFVEEMIRKGFRPPEPTTEECTPTRAVFGILSAKGNISQGSTMLTALPFFES